MHRFFFLKKAIVEHSSKIGKADWQCFRLSAFSAGVQRAVSPLCRVQGRSTLLGSRGNAHWRVEGSQPHRVKGETPCPRRIVALRQFVLGSTCRKIRRFSGFAAAPLRGNSTKIGGKRIETDTTQWQSRKKRNL